MSCLQTDPAIRLTKRDVDTFQRAKAALGAGISTLLARARMSATDLSRICVCGAFGQNLNVRNAQRIGLLPDTPPERVELCGNTALAGCERLLLSPTEARSWCHCENGRLSSISARHSDFDALFLENLYLQPLKVENHERILRSGEPQLFEAFLKSAQYLVRLQTQQDIWEHLGKFVLTHFPADWLAFVERDSGNSLSLHYCTLPEVVAAQNILTNEVRALVADVLESGFLASRVLLTPAPSMTAFLPIVENYQTSGVMLIGHTDAQPLPNELLNIYLALAGLAGTTIERKRAEEEVRRLNAELEQRVAERTAQLQTANDELLKEIVERKRVEEALRESQEWLRVTLTSIGDAVIAADTAGRVTFLNPVAAALTGWQSDEAQGQPIGSVFQLINEQTRLPVDDIVQRVLKEGRAVELANHTALLARNGREIPVEDSAAPIPDSARKVIGVVLVFHDVTERKRAEEALLRSEKLASVGRMAASIAHEINNPLAAVTNTLYLARMSANEPELVRQYLDMADDELKRVSHITRQTLGFYRESSAPTAVSVNSIVDSAVDLLRGKIKLKRGNIEKQYDGDLQVTAVSGELRQVFSNLLANSLDAIDEEGTIKLRVSRSSRVNGDVRVTVADNGKGIDAATLPRIFEPLFTTKESTGSGLGLWVSKQLIDKHHGSIRVRSSSNGVRRGTVFSVILPAQPAAAEARGQSAGA